MKPVSASLLLDTINRVFAEPGTRLGEPANAAVRNSVVPPTLAGAHILVVEDNELNQEVASALLQSGGMSADIAPNGQVAVDKVRSGDYDAVLMDMQMPVMDGLAATKAIRALPGRAKLPIIAMTANVLPEDREQCRTAGMNDHLAKPLDREKLWQTLVHWLSAPPSSQAVPSGTRTANAVPLDIPGHDVGGSIQRLGGLDQVYLSALRLFVRGHARAADDIREALDAAEHDKALRVAHTLKGVAATVGATDVERAANAIRLALVENAPRSDIDPLLKTLGAHLNETVERVKSKLPDA